MTQFAEQLAAGNLTGHERNGSPSRALNGSSSSAVATHPANVGAISAGLDVSEYQFVCTVDQKTRQQLVANNYHMYGFKAVQTNQAGGAPLVWYDLEPLKIQLTNTITWQTQYQAYISTSQIIGGGQIENLGSLPINLNQSMLVDPSGNLSITDGALSPNAVTIVNKSTIQYAAGISQPVGEDTTDASSSALCAFPLFGSGSQITIAPIQKIVVVFATTVLDTGTVLYQASGPAVLVDLTAVNTRGLSFDINNGWIIPDGVNWATPLPWNAALTDSLIELDRGTPGARIRQHSLVRP